MDSTRNCNTAAYKVWGKRRRVRIMRAFHCSLGVNDDDDHDVDDDAVQTQDRKNSHLTGRIDFFYSSPTP